MWRLIVSRPRSALTTSLRGPVVSLSVLCAQPPGDKPRTRTKTPRLGPKGMLTPLPAPPRRGADATGAACVRWGAEYDALRGGECSLQDNPFPSKRTRSPVLFVSRTKSRRHPRCMRKLRAKVVPHATLRAGAEPYHCENDQPSGLQPRHTVHVPTDQPADSAEPRARVSADLPSRSRPPHGGGTWHGDNLGQGAAGRRCRLRGRAYRRPTWSQAEDAARADPRSARRGDRYPFQPDVPVALGLRREPAGAREFCDRFRPRAAVARTHAAGAHCEGIGIVIPGMVDRRSGRVFNAPQLGWRDVQVRSGLVERTGLPVHIENSGAACALAHLWLGPGERRSGIRDFVYVTVSDGVGTGVVVDGEVVRGHGHTAGEFGHIPIGPDGPRCLCGAQGCLEAHTSNLATVARYLGYDFSPAVARELLQQSSVTVDDVIRRAGGGDERARAALLETGRYLGLGL